MSDDPAGGYLTEDPRTLSLRPSKPTKINILLEWVSPMEKVG